MVIHCENVVPSSAADMLAEDCVEKAAPPVTQAKSTVPVDVAKSTVDGAK